ncbi:MAG: multiheme c-type cytochrome [Pseudomonadota bacterium]|nr:multiheme c-type cytochrome [Pseudomonadota bacterium]
MRNKFEFISSFAAILVAGALMLVSPGAQAQDDGSEAHGAILSEDAFPSASQCAACHEQIYDEWSSSNHAYASISPMFHKFEQAINALTQGTIGAFCVRCHQSAGTTLGEDRDAPLWERSQISREGVSCIVCHRVEDNYTKANGERYIVPGDINQPIFGPYGGDGVAEVIENKSYYRVATSEEERGTPIHTEGVKFAQLSRSEFCVSCHQVAINLGIKLEVVWEQYRASPAAAAGVTCQDCHMGEVPGVAAGYETGPAAVVNGEEINPDRKHSNHSFYGPGYPIAHPGIFPHNPEAENWTIEEWLEFDWRAGWGEEEFEEAVDEEEIEVEFPEIWEDSFDREEARAVIEENLEKLEDKRRLRLEVMENGSRIDGPFFESPPTVGSDFSFSYNVVNTDDGHNLPSGSLGAQPEIWLNVALIDPDGINVWESGYVDGNGDMADLHSLDVAAGNIDYDHQLFNLQTKFLTTNVKGTDREMYLPVNFDVDQLPFLRPAPQPTTVINHPPFVRMEGRSLPPLSSRAASYTVPADVMTKAGTYRLAVRLRSRAEPIYFMRFVGATVEMEQSMNDWMMDIHPYTVEFQVN